MMDKHKCSQCGNEYELPVLPSISETLIERGGRHIPFSTYVYVICPECGKKDWADERRFWGVLGPRSFYALGFILALIAVIGVFYIGFF